MDLYTQERKNLILLVFIVLASMFVSSGVNNIISVTTALDDYLEMAGAPDYLAVTMNKSGAVDIDLWQRAGSLHLQTAYAQDERRDFCENR